MNRHPTFSSGAEVKVSHSAVAATRILTSLAVRNDRLLMRLFDWAAGDLPLSPPGEARRRSRAALLAAQERSSGADYGRNVLRPTLGRTSDGSAAK